MKRVIAIIFGLFMLISLSSCFGVGENLVSATGEILTRRVADVGSYSELEIRDIKIKKGTNYTGPKVNIDETLNRDFKITAQKSLLDSIKVDESGKKITIYGDKNNRYITDNDVEIEINGMMFTYMDLSGAVVCKMGNVNCDEKALYTLSGASILNANTLNANSLTLQLSGASQFNAQEIISSSFKIGASGASQINTKGTIKNAEIVLSGASMFKSFDCIIDSLNVSLSGASQLSATVNNTITGSASGASIITYDGKPTVTVDVSGASQIKQR